MGKNFAKARAVLWCVMTAIAFSSMSRPAHAQFFGFWGYHAFHWGVGPRDVADIVNQRQMRLTAPPYRNQNVFVADTVDIWGYHHRLIIDGGDGRVLQVFNIGPPPAINDRAREPVALPHQGRRVVNHDAHVIMGIDGHRKKPKRTLARRASAHVQPAPNPVVTTTPLAAPPASPATAIPVPASPPSEAKAIAAPPVTVAAPETPTPLAPNSPAPSSPAPVENTKVNAVPVVPLD